MQPATITLASAILIAGTIPSIFTASALPAQPADSGAGTKGQKPVSGLDDLQSLLEPVRQKHKVPALAAAVIRQGRIVAAGAVGVRQAATTVPVTIEDQFHLGSCTKAMTATLVGVLVDEGQLRWSITLAEALQEVVSAMHPDYQDVTLLDLLQHRAGLPANEPKEMSFLDLHRLKGTPTEQRSVYVQALLSEPPYLKPRTKFFYSNAGYAVASFIAERAAKTSWEELMQQRIFRPLGMTTAGFGAMGSPDEIDQPRQHVVRDGKPISVKPGPRSDNPVVISPAGRVHCSIVDWAKFVAVHVTPDGTEQDLLKPETLRRLHTPPTGGDSAAGWMVTERPWGGGKVLTHAGSNTMNFAVVWVAPERHFAVLCATNQGGDAAFGACDEAASALIGKFLQER